MNILFISEHFSPKVGGTVSYVKNTTQQVALSGHTCFILIPGLSINGELIEEKTGDNITLLRVPVSSHEELKFDSKERILFCKYIETNILNLTKKYKIDLVHLLYGLYVAEILNTESLVKRGIKTFHTIHNIPPEECSVSWSNDKWYRRFKDGIRKIGVKWVNKKRIKKNAFDVYITPSEAVKKNLRNYLPESRIEVIAHGKKVIPYSERKNIGTKSLEILTVGGIVPHKNQHLIPIIIKYLLEADFDIKWNIAGPIRNRRYYDYLLHQIERLKVNANVNILTGSTDQELHKLYTSSDLYIQLSKEEGFCMTVLDAICYRLPVLATPVGAIPEMLELIGGTLIELDKKNLNKIIAHYLKISDSIAVRNDLYEEFVSKYTWENAVDNLVKLYHV